jgi:hypothetical protein
MKIDHILKEALQNKSKKELIEIILELTDELNKLKGKDKKKESIYEKYKDKSVIIISHRWAKSGTKAISHRICLGSDNILEVKTFYFVPS